MAAEDYARLRRYAQATFHVPELPKDVIDELGTVAPADEASQFDDEYNS